MKKIRYSLVIFMSFVLLFGCTKDFLDINEDPNNPKSAETNMLLTGIQVSLAYTYNYYLDAALLVYSHQLTTREAHDKYGINGDKWENTNSWSGLYGVIPEIDYLIAQAVEEDNLHYAGVAKLIKAYLYAQAVDIWGDVPFSEVNKFDEGIQFPTWDKDEEVYNSVFALIDEAIADLENEDALNLKEMGSDDLIYGGNIENWIRMGNTLKLKMYNQIRKYKDVSSEVAALISEDMLIESGGDFEFWFTESTTPDERHPMFASEYGGSQSGYYISPWFYETLIGKNEYVFTGITDPRRPYYICNQIAPDGDTENPPEYRDGGFVSIYFGSDGTNRDHSGRGTFTFIGNYICGGKYDDGSAEYLDAESATGIAPYRMITYADRLFIEAELAAAGVAQAGSERDLLESAINASFVEVDECITRSGEDAPVLAGSTSGNAYITEVLAEYDAGDADHKMEVIMSQKWISTFGKGVDQYTDYRRTGYPVLFDPSTMVADGGPDGSGEVPVSVNREMQRSLPWRQAELDLNPNAPDQKSSTDVRVFWDVN